MSSAFSSSDARHLTALAMQAGIAINNAELHSRLSQQQQLLKAVLRDINDGLVVVDARSQIGAPHSRTIRDLYWCKYWFWELRDDYEALAPLYRDAWLYESRSGHLGSNLERYHAEAQLDIARADKINTMTYEDFVRAKRFPALEEVLGLR